MRTRSTSSPRATREPMRRALLLLFLGFASCQFDRADRWVTAPVTPRPICTAGALRCNGALEQCDEDGFAWTVKEDCPKRSLLCSGSLFACVKCEPRANHCDG